MTSIQYLLQGEVFPSGRCDREQETAEGLDGQSPFRLCFSTPKIKLGTPKSCLEFVLYHTLKWSPTNNWVNFVVQRKRIQMIQMKTPKWCSRPLTHLSSATCAGTQAAWIVVKASDCGSSKYFNKGRNVLHYTCCNFNDHFAYMTFNIVRIDSISNLLTVVLRRRL